MMVLLFVQNGDARPKCVSQSVGFDPAERPDHSRWLPGADYCVGSVAHEQAMSADRWWLVECKNAECGRGLIAGGKPVKYAGRWAAPRGRILATGGVA